MSRSDNDRLGDIILSGRRLAKVVEYGRDEFYGNWVLQDIAAHHVGIIVDAFTHLSAETQVKFGENPKKAMTGMRVRLVHIYWETNPTIVWGTITEDIPSLLETAINEHQPPASGPTVFDADVTLVLPEGGSAS